MYRVVQLGAVWYAHKVGLFDDMSVSAQEEEMENVDQFVGEGATVIYISDLNELADMLNCEIEVAE